MNLKCLICSDLLTGYSEIFGTPCGHLFHYHCLIQWIDRSQTCPQCRARATEKTIFKIYLNVEENAETTDLAVLHNKLDNLQLQINMKNLDVKNMNEKYETVNKQNRGLREENKEQENKNRVLQSMIFALKDQVTYFKTKSKETKKLEEDLVELRRKLKEIRNVELVLAGTQDEVNNMLQNTQDPQALSILVTTLKKELIESDKSKKQLKGTVKVAHAELVACRKKLHDLKTVSLQMREDLDSHKNCESERQYLKQSLLELKSKCQRLSSGTANNISRIVSESPIPASRLAQSSGDDSPSVPEVVETITHSDSPHLRVQTSSVGLSGLFTYNQLSTGTNKNSIFKQPAPRIEALKRPSSSYDGLGGHSKDEEFPSPRSSLPNKKPRTSLYATARKFKKLGPQQKLSFQKL